MGNSALDCRDCVAVQGQVSPVPTRKYLMKKIGLLLIFIATLEVSAQIPRAGRETSSPPRTAKPKLVLAIVVDQFRYDYLLRFEKDYTAGLRQLLDRGAVFVNARIDQLPTFTSAGHSTFLSGAYPAVSGIIGNQWYDRYRRTMIRSVSDDLVQVVGAAGRTGSSPHNLLVSTIGDEMKIANKGLCRVVGISMKDYSSILATGHMADAAYWFDAGSGNFVTSTYYVSELPGWVKEFNAGHPADRYRGMAWFDTKLVAESSPRLYGMLQSTPFGNELVEEMAEAAIKGEGLGRHSQTDLLMLSFSSNDFVGHRYGPDSDEVRDMSIKTDRVLGKLFRFIESHVGMANVTVVFSADHGVAPMPEVNAKLKMPGGQVTFTAVLDAVQKALAQKFGDGKWILSTPEEAIYLDWDLMNSKELAPEEVDREAAQATLSVPHVFRVYTREQILSGREMEDQIGRCVMHGFSQRYGADLYVLLDPYYIFGNMSTTHGTVYGYDNHVPVIFMGPGLKAGKYHASIIVNDIAPTLATILKVEIPSGSEGRILSEMFRVP